MLGRIIKTKEARIQWIFERMTKELTALTPSTMKIKVGAPRERVLGMVRTIYLIFPHHFQADPHDESGPSIVHSGVCLRAHSLHVDSSVSEVHRFLFFY